MNIGKARVVLDSNVVISASLSYDGTPAEIFRMVLRKEIDNYSTKEIIEEIRDVINRKKFSRVIEESDKNRVFQDFVNNSSVISPKFDEKVIKDDDDNKFINCALAAKADIISGDKHLLSLKGYKGIRIMSPKEFLDKFKKKNN